MTATVHGPDPAVAAAPTGGDGARTAGRLAVAATVVALVPFVVAAWQVVGARLVPVGDTAIIDWRTRDVLTAATPLLGAYSRFGWNHPGPVMYWLLAPFTLLTGQAWGTYLGAIVVQAIAVGWSARLAWRRGGITVTLAVLLVQTLTYTALRVDYPLLRPWNPTIALPYFVVFALLVWAVIQGELRRVPAAAGVGSFLVLTHVGYLTLVGTGAVAVAWGWWRYRRELEAGARRTVLVVSTAVIGVLWLPALVEQLAHGRDGNLAELARSAAGARLPHGTQASLAPIGFRTGLGLWLAEFRWLPPWAGGHEVRILPAGFVGPVRTIWVVVPIMAFAIGAWAAWRTHERAVRTAVALAAAFAVAAIVGLSQVRGDLTNYAFYWRIPVALLVLAATTGAVVRLAVRRTGSRCVLTVVGALLTVALVVGSVVNTRRVHAGDRNAEVVMDITQALADRLESRLPGHGNVQFLQAGDAGVFSGVMVGVVDALARDGHDVGVSTRYSDAYVDGRHAVGGRRVTERWLVTAGQSIGVVEARTGLHPIALVTPLDAADESRLRTLEADLRSQLRDAGREDLMVWLQSPSPAKVERVLGPSPELAELAALNAKLDRTGSYRYAVFAFRDREPPWDLVAY